MPIAFFLSIFVPLCILYLIKRRWGEKAADHPATVGAVLLLMALPYIISNFL